MKDSELGVKLKMKVINTVPWLTGLKDLRQVKT